MYLKSLNLTKLIKLYSSSRSIFNDIAFYNNIREYITILLVIQNATVHDSYYRHKLDDKHME